MKRNLRLLSAVFLIVMAFGFMVFPQSDSVDGTVQVTNQAVFATMATDFPSASSPAAVALTDVETGCIGLSNATVNIDATSTYEVTAQVTGSTVPGGVTVSDGAGNEGPLHLATSAVCPSLGTEGTVSLTVGSGSSTAGTTGDDHDVFAGLFFAIPSGETPVASNDSVFSDAPNGSYDFTVTVTVTDN